MIKILFLIPNLGGGGAEKVLVNLVNNMDKTKFDITVETLFDGGVNRQFLNEDINYICKGAKRISGITRIYSYIPARILYKYFVGKNHYDIVVAYMHGTATHIVSGCSDRKTKKITWIHNGDMEQTSLFNSFYSYKKAVKELKKFDAIVPVAQSIADALYKKTGIKDKVTVCYNTNDVDNIVSLSKEKIKIPHVGPLVCSVGRFTPDKGFVRLIKASTKLKEEGYDHTLLLVGDGIDFEKTKNISDELRNDVIYTGYQKNPYKYMKNSDIFICSSTFEGMCTATVEALIVGTASISTLVSGAREALGCNNEYGLIVDNSCEGIYKGLKEFLKNPELIDEYAIKAKNSAHRFSIKETVTAVEQLLESVLDEQHNTFN